MLSNTAELIEIASDLPSVAELVAHIRSHLATEASTWREPFPVHQVSNIFPPAVLAALDTLPCTPKQMTGARAHNNASRSYFTTSYQSEHPVAALLASAFQDHALVADIARSCGARLDDTHLLIEFACDMGTSTLAPHRDIGTKRFTGLFYVATDPALSNAGTDIYTARADRLADIAEAAKANGDAPREMFEEKTKRPLYGPGLGYYFVPSDVSWHGFDQREIAGLRKTVIVNYLGVAANGERYRNTQNLCFPDRPVTLAG